MTELEIAKQNGHQPGHIFDNFVCFCKKCDAPLTYLSGFKEKATNDKIKPIIPNIRGLFNGKCRG